LKKEADSAFKKRTIKLWNHHWFRGVAAILFFSLYLVGFITLLFFPANHHLFITNLSTATEKVW
jgi:hypothetical protein